MTATGAFAPPDAVIEWGVAGRAFPGQSASGDRHVVAIFPGGALAAVIDGLGHGDEAAEAAQRAVDVLSEDPGLSLGRLVERCHAALRSSRGAVMTLAAFDSNQDQLTWTAVGNVEAALHRAGTGGPRESVVPRGGVVGYQLPALRHVTLSVQPSDVLILATDGVGHDFILETPSHGSTQGFADHLLDRYGKTTDDALVLVVRYLGRTQ